MASEMLESYVDMIEAGMDPDTTKMLIGEIASFVMVQEGTSLPTPLVRRLQGICIKTITESSSDEEMWRTGVTLAQAVAKNGEASGSMAAMLPPPELVTAMASKIELAITIGEKPLADGMFEFLRVISRCTRGRYRHAMGRSDSDGASSAASIDNALATAACSLIASVTRLHMDRVHIEKALQLAADVVRAASRDVAPAAAITHGFAAQAGALMFSSNPSIAEASAKLLQALLKCASSQIHGLESSIAALEGKKKQEGASASASPLFEGSEAAGESGAPGATEDMMSGLVAQRLAAELFLAQVVGVTASLVVATLRGAGGNDDAVSRVLRVSEIVQSDDKASPLFAQAAARVGLRDAVCKGIFALAGQATTAAAPAWAAVRSASGDVIKLGVLDSVISETEAAELLGAMNQRPSDESAVRSHAVGTISYSKTLFDLAVSLQRADAEASKSSADTPASAAGTSASSADGESSARRADVLHALTAGCDACQASLAAMDDKPYVPEARLETAEAFRGELITSVATTLSCSPVSSLLADPLLEALCDAIYGVKSTQATPQASTSAASAAGAASAASGETGAASAASGETGAASAASGETGAADMEESAEDESADTCDLVMPAEFSGSVGACTDSCVAGAVREQQVPLAAYFLDFLGALPKDEEPCVMGLKCMYALLWHCDAHVSAWLIRLGGDEWLRSSGDVRPTISASRFTRAAPTAKALWCWRVSRLIETKIAGMSPSLSVGLEERAATADLAWVTAHPEAKDKQTAQTPSSMAVSSDKRATSASEASHADDREDDEEEEEEDDGEAEEEATYAKLAGVPGFGQLARQPSVPNASEAELRAPVALGDRQTSAVSSVAVSWDPASVRDALFLPELSLVEATKKVCEQTVAFSKARIEDMLQTQSKTARPVADDAAAAASVDTASKDTGSGGHDDLNAIVLTPASFARHTSCPLTSRVVVRLVVVVDRLIEAATQDRMAVKTHGLASDEAANAFWGCVSALLELRKVLQPPAVITGSEFVGSRLPLALAVFMRVTPLDGVDAAVQEAESKSDEGTGDESPTAIALIEHAASPSLDSLLGARRLQAVALAFGGTPSGQVRDRLKATMPEGLELPFDAALAPLVSLTQFAAGEHLRGCWSSISHRGVFAEPSQLAHFGKHKAVFELRPTTRASSIMSDQAILSGASKEQSERVGKASSSLFGTFRVSVPLTASARHVEQRLIACLSRWAVGTVTDTHGRQRMFGRLALGAWEGRGLRPLRLRLEWASSTLQDLDQKRSIAPAGSVSASSDALALTSASSKQQSSSTGVVARVLAPTERLLAVHSAAGGIVIYIVLRHASSGSPYIGVHVRSLVASTARVWLAVGAAPDGFTVETGAAHDASGRIVSPDERSAIAVPLLSCSVPTLHSELNEPSELAPQKSAVTSPPKQWSQVLRVVVPPGGMIRDAVAFLPTKTATSEAAAAASASAASDSEHSMLAQSELLALHLGKRVVIGAPLQWAWEPIQDDADDLTTWPANWPTPAAAAAAAGGDGDADGKSRTSYATRKMRGAISKPAAPMYGSSGWSGSSKNSLWQGANGLADGVDPGLGDGAYAGVLSKARCLAGSDVAPGTKEAIYGDMDIQNEGPVYEGMLVSRVAVGRVVRLDATSASACKRLPAASGTLSQPFADGLAASLATRAAVAAAGAPGGSPFGAIPGRSLAAFDAEAGFASPSLHQVSELPPASSPPSALFMALPGSVKQLRVKSYGTSGTGIGTSGIAQYALVTVIIADTRKHVPDRAGLPVTSIPGCFSTALLPADAKDLSNIARETGSITSALRGRGRRSGARRGGSGSRYGGGGQPASAAAAAAAAATRVQSMLEASLSQVGSGVTLEPSMEQLRTEMGVPSEKEAYKDSTMKEGEATSGPKPILPGSLLEHGGYGGAIVALHATAEDLDEEIALAKSLALPVPDDVLSAMEHAREASSAAATTAKDVTESSSKDARPVAFRFLIRDQSTHRSMVNVCDLDGKFGAPGTVFIHSRPILGYGSSLLSPPASTRGGGTSSAEASVHTGDDVFYPPWFSRLSSDATVSRLSPDCLNAFRLLFRTFASVPLLPSEHELVEASLSGALAGVAGDKDRAGASSGAAVPAHSRAAVSEHSLAPESTAFLEGRYFLQAGSSVSAVELEDESRPVLSLGGAALRQPSSRPLPRALSGNDFVRLVESLSGPQMSSSDLASCASQSRALTIFQKLGRSYALAVVEACKEHGTELPAFVEVVQAGITLPDGTPRTVKARSTPKHMSHATVQRLVRSLLSPSAREIDASIVPPPNAYGVHYRPMLADAVLTEVDFIAFFIEAVSSRKPAVVDDLASMGLAPTMDGFIAPLRVSICTPALPHRLDRGWSAGSFSDAQTLREGGSGALLSSSSGHGRGDTGGGYSSAAGLTSGAAPSRYPTGPISGEEAPPWHSGYTGSGDSSPPHEGYGEAMPAGIPEFARMDHEAMASGLTSAAGGGGGPGGPGGMSDEEQLAAALAASLADVQPTPQLDSTSAAEDIVAAGGETADQSADEAGSGSEAEAFADDAPAAVNDEPEAETMPAATGSPDRVIAMEIAELIPAPASQRLPAHLARIQSDLALRDAASGSGVAGIAATMKALAMGRAIPSADTHRVPQSCAEAVAILAVSGCARADPTSSRGSLSLSALLEGAELLHVRSEAIANGQHAPADSSAPPLPPREFQEEEEEVAAAGSAPSLGRRVSKEPLLAASPGTNLVPFSSEIVADSGDDSLVDAEPVWLRCKRLLAQVATFDRAPAGGTWMDAPSELAAVIPDAEEDDEDEEAAASATVAGAGGGRGSHGTTNRVAKVRGGVSLAAMAAASGHAMPGARSLGVAQQRVRGESRRDSPANASGHSELDAAARVVFSSGGGDGDGLLSRSMKDSRRHAQQMEQSDAAAASARMAPVESAEELDVFAVEQVLARVAMAGAPSQDASLGIGSLEVAAMRSHGPLADQARRNWAPTGDEDQEAIAYVSPDDVLRVATPESAASTTEPSFSIELIEIEQLQDSGSEMQAMLGQSHRRQRSGEVVEARNILAQAAVEQALATFNASSVQAEAASTSDAALANALLRAAVGSGSASDAASASPSPSGASGRQLSDIVSVCTSANAANLLRPENLVMGLAQRPRLLINGRPVDPGCSVYAIDTYAPTLKEPSGSKKAQAPSTKAPISSTKSAAGGAEAWRLGGVPLCLVSGSPKPTTSVPKPDSPPGLGYTGCYIAVDWSRAGSRGSWYGGVVRSALPTPTGVVHVVDFDDGDCYIINLNEAEHVVIALAGTFGHTPDIDAAAADSCPHAHIDVGACGGWHRVGRIRSRVPGATAARKELARILSESGIASFTRSRRLGYGYGHGHARSPYDGMPGNSKPAAAEERPVHMLHYDLDATSLPLHERVWASTALGETTLALADAGRGPLGFGPLVAAFKAPSCFEAVATASAASVDDLAMRESGTANDLHAGAVVAAMATSAAPQPSLAPDLAVSDFAASSPSVDHDDGSVTRLFPVSLLVNSAKLHKDVCAMIGLPADTSLPPMYPLFAKLRISKRTPAAKALPVDSSRSNRGAGAAVATYPVLLSGGEHSLTTAFARAAPSARLSRSVARGTPVVPLCQPSMLRADANLFDAGNLDHAESLAGAADGAASRLARGGEALSLTFPGHVAAVAAHGPWMDLHWAGSSDKAVGDALAVLRMIGSLAESLSEAQRSQDDSVLATDSSGIASRISSAVVSPDLFAVRGATSACYDQMSDNVALAYGCLPRWLGLAPSMHPRAIPFALRRRAFFYTAFGPTRRMLAVQDELGKAKPGDSPERAAARARTRDNDPERILPMQVKAVASRTQLLRSARAIFRWWCAPSQRFQRACALVKRAQLLAQAGPTAATIPWSAPPVSETGHERATFRMACGEDGLGKTQQHQLAHAELATAVARGSLPPSAMTASLCTATESNLGAAAVPTELAMPSPPLSHDWLGRRKAVLNVSFDGEDAHGSGVTREFYTLVMRELRDKRLGLWRDLAQEAVPPSASDASASASDASASARDASASGAASSTGTRSESRFVFAPQGLFPAPLPADADSAARVIDLVVLAGRATAKALEDGHRDIDLPISETFAKLILGEPVTLRDVATVEPDMAATTRVLEDILRAVEESDVHGDTAAADWAREQCEMLCLTWAKGSTPLVPGGDDMDVTIDNVRGFCRALVDVVVVAPAIAHATAFRHGFAGVADISRLRMFTPAEFVAVISDVSTSWASQAHLWEPESIRRELTFHDSSQFRFERNDPTISAFVEALSALSPTDKRLFLEFATASPRLPENGFAGLRPKRLQINRRNPKAGHTADDEAIFCRVCTSELSLPAYSSAEVLRSRLHEAIHSIADGLGGFRQHA